MRRKSETYRGCQVEPVTLASPHYFGVGVNGTDSDGYSRRCVQVTFPDQTWVQCANNDEARRYIDGLNGIVKHQ